MQSARQGFEVHLDQAAIQVGFFRVAWLQGLGRLRRRGTYSAARPLGVWGAMGQAGVTRALQIQSATRST